MSSVMDKPGNEYERLLALAEQKAAAANQYRTKGKAGGAGRGPDPAAIAAFKARKEREEQEKAARAQRVKERLLALRAQSSKSMRKSKAMQNRTKDNDFSRIQFSEHEVKDKEKVDEKIHKSGIRDTKERMKARIQMDETLAGMSRKDRERTIARMDREAPVKVVSPTKRPTVPEIIAKSKSSSLPATKGPGAIKTNRPKAPTMSYDEMLKVAIEKSKTKMTLEEHIKREMDEAKKAARPMTQKEKERAREEAYYRSRSDQARLPTHEERARASGASSRRPAPTKEPSPEPYEPEPYVPGKRPGGGSMMNGNGKAAAAGYKPNGYQPSSRPPAKPTPTGPPQRNGGLTNGHSRPTTAPPPPPPPYQPKPSASMQRSTPNGSSQYRDTGSSGQRPSANLGPGRFDRDRMPPPSGRPSSSLSQQSKSRLPPIGSGPREPRPPPPPPPSRPRAYSPPPYIPTAHRSKLPPIGATYRRGMYNDYEPETIEEDEDDYYEDEEDDDMADFIDDGPAEEDDEPEYSKVIREVFKYDKRKYARIDDEDDDIEEASFAQCMKEESASLRAGIREDLEDIRKEEEEKRAKAAARKRAKMGNYR